MSQLSDVIKNRSRAFLPFEEEDDGPTGPSKSQRKRDSLKKQSLGERIVSLSPGKLAKVEMPADLEEAVHLYLRLTDFGAKKRQLQFIGRLMSSTDAARIEKFLETIDHTPAVKKAVALELCDATDRAQHVLREGDEALAELAALLEPDAFQTFRQIVRNARKKLQTGSTETQVLAPVRDFILKNVPASSDLLS